MNGCFITFRSVTHAQRGERILLGEGIGCRILRTPRWMEAQGCGYSLRILQRDAPSCIAFLNEEDIPYRKVYLLRDGGALEELSL